MGLTCSSPEHDVIARKSIENGSIGFRIPAPQKPLPSRENSSTTEACGNVRELEEQLPTSIYAHGIKALLKSTSLRMAYLDFLKKEYNNSSQSISEMVSRLENGVHDYESLAAALDELTLSYEPQHTHDSADTQVDSASYEFGSPLKTHEVPFSSRDLKVKKLSRRKSLTQRAYKSQGFALVVLSTFTAFATSRTYESWCEREYALKAFCMEASKKPEKPARRAGQLLLGMKDSDAVSVDSIVEAIPSDKLTAYLSTKSWLHALRAVIEDLPICVTLATARKTQPGFPLIMVNRMFEETTGYSRSEIIGQNCKFLQSGGYCEHSQLWRLSEALRNAKPMRVRITNYRKDGSSFKNLLAIKPIFDSEGNYCFVLGVQIDSSDEDLDPLHIKVVDDLLFLLPNTMYISK